MHIRVCVSSFVGTFVCELVRSHMCVCVPVCVLVGTYVHMCRCCTEYANGHTSRKVWVSLNLAHWSPMEHGTCVYVRTNVFQCVRI